MKIILSISCIICAFISISQSNREIKTNAHYFIDKNSSIEINDLKFGDFTPFESNQTINIGYNRDAAIWCLITIKNKGSIPIETWLCFDNNQLDSIQLFQKNKIIVIGDRTNKSNTFLSTQAFKIKLNPKEERRLIFRLKKVVSFMDFSFHLQSERDLANNSNSNLFLYCFLLGILFLLVLFNCILFFINKQKLYLLYIAHTILTACYIMITSGMAKFILFQDFLYFSEFRIYTVSLWFITISLFIAHFLGINETQQRKYKIILVLNGINLLIIITTISMVSTNNISFLKLFSILGYLNFIFVMVLTIWSTIINYTLNKSNSIYVLLAFLPNCIWGLTLILKALQIIPTELETDWLAIISIYEVLLFGYVLTRNYFDTFHRNNSLNKSIIHQKELTIAAVLNAQIKERSQIANLLHDKFGSQLSHVLQLIESQNIQLIEQNIQLISKDLRDVSHQIMPKALELGNLISCLQTQIINKNNDQTQYTISLNCYDFPNQLNSTLAFNLYLISLEIISNAINHAKPKEINLEFYAYDDSFVFQFSDDGIGFESKTTEKGFGLTTIESRILNMNGSFEIMSKKDEGTIIQIVIPKTTSK